MEVETKEDAVTQTSKLHRRIVPYYLDNYVEQRPVIVSASLPRAYRPHLPEERRPETCSIPLRGIDYSQTDLAVYKSFANTHRCPPGDNMCDLCKRHFAMRQPDGRETFLNHIFLRMANRPDLNRNTKRYIIQRPHPHLPMFVFSKCLHPKIFWRESRKPRERTHQIFHGNSRPPKGLRYQRNTLRTGFNRCPNSPETTLNSTGKFEGIHLQSLESNKLIKVPKSLRVLSILRRIIFRCVHASPREALSTTATLTPPEEHQLQNRKKKHRLKSSKRKSKSEGKENEEESRTEIDDGKLTDADGEENLQDGNASSRKGIVKKERKPRNFQRNGMEGNEEPDDSDGNWSNISEKNGNEEKGDIKIEMKPPPIPRYQSKPQSLMTRSTNKQKMFMPPKQQPDNNEATNKTPPKSMFSFFGQTNTATSTNENKVYSWLQRQLDFSLRACRFELPIDGRVLQDVTPADYLRRYCVVAPQFQSLYQKVFRKYQRAQIMRINFKDLETALRDVAVNNFNREKMEVIQLMTGVDEESSIDYKLFCGIAALAERVSPDQAKRWETPEKCEEQHMSRERIETADFSALDWKLKNVKIGDKMKHILWTICS